MMDGRLSQWANEPTCLACPAERPAGAHAQGWRGPWCKNCRSRWVYHGRPSGGPPPARPYPAGPVAGRLEDYAELRAQGLSRAAAALRLGVTIRSAIRYESRLRSEGLAA
jgi:hypothetical protein